MRPVSIGIIGAGNVIWAYFQVLDRLVPRGLAQIGPVAMAVTTSLNMNFLRRGEAGRDLIGQGRLLKLGTRLAVAEFTILSDGSDDPIAHATLTYSIPPRRELGYGVK